METSLIVFDIAGTTIKDNNNVNDAFRGALGRAGYTVAPEHINEVMGYRKVEAIKMLLQKFYPGTAQEDKLINDIHADFTKEMYAYYVDTMELRAQPFVVELFRILRDNGIRVGLDTGFTKTITDVILRRLGWVNLGLVDVVVSSDEVPSGRPFPFMIAAIMRELKITDAQQVVKVGDTPVDIEEGRNAGCGMVVGVTTGAYNRTTLEEYNPDHIIDSLEELPLLLNI